MVFFTDDEIGSGRKGKGFARAAPQHFLMFLVSEDLMQGTLGYGDGREGIVLAFVKREGSSVVEYSLCSELSVIMMSGNNRLERCYTSGYDLPATTRSYNSPVLMSPTAHHSLDMAITEPGTWSHAPTDLNIQGRSQLLDSHDR
ncbi:unnamed protein product [Allacma fusca]|uniref:Uncharacterized protein n=1 Tax=Allacma fusca TaxID=39272 RepID=A0A8J2LAF7_9HEXA|nr:unnamed protein product [Allacma fusca]